MKQWLIGILFVVAAAIGTSTPVGAASLKVAPLKYDTTLKSGEKKKGFIDVSNPTGQAVVVRTSVEAFRQTDDDGTLQFFDSEQLRAGVKLDLDEFELGPREAVRMYFLLDPTRLPTGDVYGAIFFSTAPAKQTSGVGQAVKLGTLLSIVNGTPGPRDAEITDMSVSWLQLSDSIAGSYRIKNTANPSRATGFYPTVQLRASPLGEAKKQTGKLTFAGITRTNEFTLRTPPIGIYQVSVGYQGGVKSAWVVVASPAALIALAVAMLAAGFIWHVVGKARRRSMHMGSRY